MSRINVSSGLDDEKSVGMSRAVRIGDVIKVSAVGPLDAEGNVVGEDAAQQTVACFDAIGAALEAAGASLGEIVQTRIYVTNRDDWEAVTSIHSQLFAEVRPACTWAIVSELPDPAWKVQIEAEAIAAGDSDS